MRYDGILRMEISTATPGLLSTDRENAVMWLRLVDSSCLMWVKWDIPLELKNFTHNNRHFTSVVGIQPTQLDV